MLCWWQGAVGRGTSLSSPHLHSCPLGYRFVRSSISLVLHGSSRQLNSAQLHRSLNVASDVPSVRVVRQELPRVPDIGQGGEGVQSARVPAGEFQSTIPLILPLRIKMLPGWRSI